MAAPATFSPLMESIDPATGMVIARLEATPPSEVPGILAQARRGPVGLVAQVLPGRLPLGTQSPVTDYSLSPVIFEPSTRATWATPHRATHCQPLGLRCT